MKALNSRTTRTLSAAVCAGALLLTGCGSSDAGSATSDSQSSAAEAEAGAGLTITDPWAKAKEEGMTGVFGIIENAGSEPVTIVSGASDAAEAVELHETVDDGSGQMVMQEAEGGFEIPAGGSLELKPGGSHIMLMGLTGALAAGDEVSIDLTTDSGDTLTVDALVKDYDGANENYGDEEDGGHSGASESADEHADHEHEGHDHGDHEGHDHGEEGHDHG